MSNATEENRQVQTDTPAAHPNEGQAFVEIAPIISRRPTWAGETRIEPDCIVHSWTAPTVAMVSESAEETLSRAPVELYREDSLLVYPDGVALDPGPWRIFLLDTLIEDTVNARRLATALLECCDRIEQASDEDEL
jgi:hypothetical protein